MPNETSHKSPLIVSFHFFENPVQRNLETESRLVIVLCWRTEEAIEFLFGMMKIF